MSFSKKNTIIYGLNCGFGAGYMKLTYSWFCDLIKLIKIGYVVIFTYTNDYEDKKGEVAIVKDVLGGKIVLYNNDNPFKSMTTYKSEDNDNMWACGNYGYYVLQGGDRATVNKMSKLKKEDAEEIKNGEGFKYKRFELKDVKGLNDAELAEQEKEAKEEEIKEAKREAELEKLEAEVNESHEVEVINENKETEE